MFTIKIGLIVRECVETTPAGTYTELCIGLRCQFDVQHVMPRLTIRFRSLSKRCVQIINFPAGGRERSFESMGAIFRHTAF